MKFTVFTPTFQRGHTLHRVYNSLLCQTLRDFEWIIVDDGSTDQTADIVLKWQKENKFSIYYEKQANQGKHVAINVGVKLSKGELFLIADSDDEFPPNALQTFNDIWINIPLSCRSNFSGVTGLCVDNSRNIIGNKFPSDIFDSTSADCLYRFGIKGEKWGFHRTEIMKKFPFPEFKSHYFPESIIWNAIGRQYKTRFINQIVRIYKDDSGNQLTNKSIIERSKLYIFYATILSNDIDYLFVAPWTLFKIAAQGSRFSLHQKDTLKRQFSRLKKWPTKTLWFFALPVGFILFQYDKFKA